MADRPALRDARTCELQKHKAKHGRDDLKRCLDCPGSEPLESAPAKVALAQAPTPRGVKAGAAPSQPPKPAAGATCDPQRVPPPAFSTPKPTASAGADRPPADEPQRPESLPPAAGAARCLACGRPIPGGPYAVVTVIVSLIPVQHEDPKSHIDQPLVWPICSATCAGRLAPLCLAVQAAAAELLEADLV